MIQVDAIPALDTNYIWLLKPQARSETVYVFDPGAAKPVLERLERDNLKLAGIVITHHHWDHTDGLDELLRHWQVPVYGPASVVQVTQPLAEGDRLTLNDLELDVIAVPGHTLDHLAYVYRPTAEDQAPCLFCGDALFAGGCGRLFEGTAAQQLDSLKKLAALPDETLVYCAHEYTRANLSFALKADPHNEALIERQRRVEQDLERHGISLPSNIREELRTNPFLRCQEPEIKARVEAHSGRKLNSEAELFAALRRWKDAS